MASQEPLSLMTVRNQAQLIDSLNRHIADMKEEIAEQAKEIEDLTEQLNYVKQPAPTTPTTSANKKSDF